ncbi:MULTISPECIES: pyruvate kinase [Megasphaera]|uniref:Pyruvate kinase n=1 Tax=Megasphaera hutchinsoni TaxID=1588748 RepID=A0A134CEJ6_9FIRM|nr:MULTISPECIES: pyruvate kinase [Megasphaera]EGS32158.1 pyruvate kinase [Megasphaera sp. UPII 135-E]KXB90554.1 pyruvate kinase [Megasphaera hutchinsoni]MUP48860.1 pyruvate kinase [Veillonellaceae bacterium M2-8]
MPKKTKIVCTLGPSSQTPEIIENLINSGMNIARFNFSHGTHEEHKKRIDLVRNISKKSQIPIALMLDTKGPEIRLGSFENGSIIMKAGQPFTLTTRSLIGNETIASVNYKDLPKDISIGSHILLSDGLVTLSVERITDTEIHTQILNTGKMSDRKRVAIPGTILNLPAISQSDIEDILFGIDMHMDFIAASFIQKGEDIIAIRKLLEDNHSTIKIIAKIECQTAVQNIDEIIQLSDGIMVARGDLGVEIPAEKVPTLQKMLIQKCNIAGKPVITATQMLESMCANPRPTRAETSDVANAILDGTDAIMLSGETANGLYPIEAVTTMNKVATYTEGHYPFHHQTQHYAAPTTTESIGKGVVKIAEDLHAAAIIASTEKGSTAQMISKFRPSCPIIAVSPHKDIIRTLQLNWGVQAILGEPAKNSDEVVHTAIQSALTHHLINVGDLVVLTAGVPVGQSGSTNMIRVQVVGDILLSGTGIGKGSAIGTVCIADTLTNLKQRFTDDCILVLKSAEPEFISYMKRAKAIVAEESGLTSEAAIIALTLGLPAVIGAKNATKILKNNDTVTVDSNRDTIFRGITNAR